MMKMRQTEAAGSIVAALSLCAPLLLTACDERPYPESSASGAASPTAQPPAALAGVPAPPAQPPGLPPPGAHTSHVAPTIVAMAPIPNPGDPGSEGYYPRRDHSRRNGTHVYDMRRATEGAAPPRPLARPTVFAKAANVPLHVLAKGNSAPMVDAKAATPGLHAAAPKARLIQPAYAKAIDPPVLAAFTPNPAKPVRAETMQPPAEAAKPPPKAYAGVFLTPPGPATTSPTPTDGKPATPPPSDVARSPKPAGDTAVASVAQKGVTPPLLPAFLLIAPLIFAVLDLIGMGSGSRRPSRVRSPVATDFAHRPSYAPDLGARPTL